MTLINTEGFLHHTRGVYTMRKLKFGRLFSEKTFRVKTILNKEVCVESLYEGWNLICLEQSSLDIISLTTYDCTIAMGLYNVYLINSEDVVHTDLIDPILSPNAKVFISKVNVRVL